MVFFSVFLLTCSSKYLGSPPIKRRVCAPSLNLYRLKDNHISRNYIILSCFTISTPSILMPMAYFISSMAEHYVIVWHTTSSWSSPLCFHVLHIVNNAAINRRAHSILSWWFFKFLRYVPKVGIAMLFEGKSRLLLQMTIPVYILTSSVIGSLFLCILSSQVGVLMVLKTCHSYGYEVVILTCI